MVTDYNIVAVFKKEENKPKIDILTKEAKAFKKLTYKQKENSPKFYQNWSHFLSYLKRRGYGNSEKEILSKLNLERNHIIWAVKKYIRD